MWNFVIFFPSLSFIMEIFALYSQRPEFNFVRKSPIGGVIAVYKNRIRLYHRLIIVYNMTSPESVYILSQY